MSAEYSLEENTNDQPAIAGYRVLFFRGLSLFYIWFSIHYWMQLVGFSTGPNVQFDLMSEHWRIAVAMLAVLLPVVALGLWGLFSWGIAVWLLAVVIEATMYLGFPELFGANQTLLIFHAVTLLIFSVVQLLGRNSHNKV